MPITIVLVTILKPNHFFKNGPSHPRLNEVQRSIAIGQLQAGKKQIEVARAMGVSQQAISALAKKFRATGIVKDLPRPGRPRVTTEREDRSIIATARENPFFSGKKFNINMKPCNLFKSVRVLHPLL